MARAVLGGKTKGYVNHPQLERFKSCAEPLSAIDAYLSEVVAEAERRGYKFDRSKIVCSAVCAPIKVNDGQLRYEAEHLKHKLAVRDAERYRKLTETKNIEPHPIFEVVKGGIELWEKVK